MGSIPSTGSTTSRTTDAPGQQPPGPTPGPIVVTARHGRFWRRVALGTVTVLAVVAGGATALVTTLRGDQEPPAEQAVVVPDAQLPELGEATPVLAALPADAPVPDAAALQAAIGPLLAAPALGAGLSAEVVDVATGESLLAVDAADPSVPASSAKLLTAVAALTSLDPAATFETRVVAGATPDEVVLVGGGDVTLSRQAPSALYPGAPTVADLAAQVVAALPAGTEVGRVVVDNSLYTGPLTAPGWGSADAPSTYAAPVTATAVDGARVAPDSEARSGQPGLDAGAALADALGAPAATVVLGQAPAGAETLASVESAPVVRLVEQMLALSDNVLAESIARQVALARGPAPDFAGAAEAVTAALDEAGLDTTGVRLTDGSGLARDNRVPAGLLVDVLVGASDGSLAGASTLLSGLPVAGYDGTLADRGDDDAATAPGSVRAKTGTLNGVHALAGTVVTADGRLLAFTVLADGATGGEQAAEAALDEIAAALAACGC